MSYFVQSLTTVLFGLGLALSIPISLSAANNEITEIIVTPKTISLFEPEKGHSVLVTGVTKNGEKIDLTAEADFETTDDNLQLRDDGLIYGKSQGTARVKVTAAGNSVEIAVEVGDMSRGRQPTFVRDIMPILNKVGCTSGPCHGSANGKNGFKLSLRGYDARSDYDALLYEVSGRRVNRAAPADSLMIAKPTQAVPHQGGFVLSNTRHKKDILRWISEGATFGDTNKDGVVRLEVLPKEIFMQRPGMRQQILVIAHYGDGTTRDVTRAASVKSNVETVAAVGEGAEHAPTAVRPGPAALSAGQALVGERIGEAALQVRYEGKFVTVPITVLNPEQGFAWTNPPQYNFIDKHVDAKLERMKIEPSPLADDATFLRRVYLDLNGVPPTPSQAKTFLEDPETSRLKRQRLVEKLMKRKEFVDHWANKWGDLLQNNRKYLGEKGTWIFRQWIRDSIAANKPYDEMVHELITSVGSTYQNPATNFFRVNDNPKTALENTTQIFMGVRMVCANCHDHPFERWTQNQYYELAAFFSAVGLKPGFDNDEQIVYVKRDKSGVKYPQNGKYAEPQYLVATSGAPPIPDDGDRREALSGWLTSDKNPFFARAITNRLWSYFMGRGIIEPVDDIRASNPPVNEALLAALAQDFVSKGYDLQQVIRTIVNSRVYQASITTNKWNESDEINFSRFTPRRLPAETLLDSIAVATGSEIQFAGVPKAFRAQELPDSFVGKGGFLDVFGRPQRESSCECERRDNMGLPHAMNLVNGPTLAEAIADPDGRIAKAILAGTSSKNLVDELYLATYSRFPTPNEHDAALTYINKGPSRASRAQDLLWALVNSNAFLFNH